MNPEMYLQIHHALAQASLKWLTQDMKNGYFTSSLLDIYNSIYWHSY